jgi:hypothetical protein
MVICARACCPAAVTVYWFPVVIPDPIGPLYASVTDCPVASRNPPLLETLPGKPPEKFPEKVLEKFPEKVLEKLREKVRVKDVELKEEKLNRAVGTGFRVLLLCTMNVNDPARQGGSAKRVRVWLVCDVVVVAVVELETHPLPGVTSKELMDTACEPMFWMVTTRVVPESAALLISTFSWVAEAACCVVETAAGALLETLEDRL